MGPPSLVLYELPLVVAEAPLVRLSDASVGAILTDEQKGGER